MAYSNDFGPFDENRTWLNCASEGPMPKTALGALAEAGEWKRKPYLLTHKRFRDVPERLKTALAALISAEAQDIILGNSATYGIHLLANGLPLAAGDEVLVMQNDFPTDILPWLGLQKKGVVIKQIPSAGPVVSPEELEAAVTARTRVICLSHVHTFSGHILDVQEVAALCRKHGIRFILNLSQSAGNREVSVGDLGADAVTCAAFKWLCGPYGTGFCWIKPEVRVLLEYNQNYWINTMTDDELKSDGRLELSTDKSARRWDVFGTANFFNFYPLSVSVEYLLSVGIEKVKAHNDRLQDLFLAGLDRDAWDLVSPEDRGGRSALICFSHKQAGRNEEIFRELVRQGIYPALWKGILRISPHIFNTDEDIRRLLEALRRF